MRSWLASCRPAKVMAIVLGVLVTSVAAMAEPGVEPAGEAGLKLPDLSAVFFHGINGHKLLLIGLVLCALGLLFGLAIYMQLKNLPVHRAMLRNLRADLRDLQDLSGHAGQVPADPVGLHRRRSSCCTSAVLSPVPASRSR